VRELLSSFTNVTDATKMLFETFAFMPLFTETLAL